MADPFFGIRVKLQRAYEQLDAFYGEMAAFLDTDPYEPRVQFRRVPGNLTAPIVKDFAIRMIVKKPCPPMWSVIIGEIVHDLRSALDHSIFELVIHATGTWLSEESRTQFPIFIDDAKYDTSSLPMLRGVSDNAAVLIKSFQPFATGEGTKSPLWHLCQLSNFDKHRSIHLTGGTLEAFKFSFPPFANPTRVESQVRKRGAFEHDTEIARGRMFGEGQLFDSDQVKMKAEIAFDIVFDQRTPVIADCSVIRTLRDAADRTRDCLDRIGRERLNVSLVLKL